MTRYRRTIPQNVKDIGIWYEIMQSLTRIAVITNAFIIAITSDFIPQLVYKYSYSPYGSMQGYVNFTLSYFNTTDLDTGKTSLATDIPEICRYRYLSLLQVLSWISFFFLDILDITSLHGQRRNMNMINHFGTFGLSDLCLLFVSRLLSVFVWCCSGILYQMFLPHLGTK